MHDNSTLESKEFIENLIASTAIRSEIQEGLEQARNGELIDSDEVIQEARNLILTHS